MKKINLKLLILILCVISINFFVIGLYPTNNQIHDGSEKINQEAPQLSFGFLWESNGIAISTASNDQSGHAICSDGAGGAIITWQDERSGIDVDIYAQGVDSNGTVQWIPNGIAICTASDDQTYPQICSDEAGGAIITWTDLRSGNSDIYAQKINSNGEIQWTPNGIEICNASGIQNEPKICSDGAGGAIITWEDERSGYFDIYAQKVDSFGTVQWDANGTAICTAYDVQFLPQICSDGAGGAIITWEDEREFFDVYAQKVDSFGTVQWDANGTAISTAYDAQSLPQICSDGAGGAIITWQDERSGDYDVYAQRVDLNGITQWTANGTAICTVPDLNTDMFADPRPLICSDELGGAIIIWQDSRSSTEELNIYAQRVNSIGSVRWSIDGIPINTADVPAVGGTTICSIGSGDVIIAWTDGRTDSWEVYAQQVNSSGNVQWTTNGKLISQLDGWDGIARTCSDGAGGVIISWIHFEGPGNYDIYAQRIKHIPSDGDGDGAIPFGNYYLLFVIFGILSLIIIKKKQIFRNSKL